VEIMLLNPMESRADEARRTKANEGSGRGLNINRPRKTSHLERIGVVR
jgi:hypothetical protein